MQYLYEKKFSSWHKRERTNTHLRTMVIFDTGGGKGKKGNFFCFNTWALMAF